MLSLPKDLLTASSRRINWQAVIFTVLTLQGVYYLGYAVNDAVSLMFVPIQYQRLSRVINNAIFQKAQRTDICCFDNPEFYDTYTWTASNYISKGDNCVTLLRNLLANVFTIATLLFLLTSAGWMISLITVLYVAATTFINVRIAETNYEKRKASTPVDRKKNYIHGLFYNCHWATDQLIQGQGRTFLPIYYSDDDAVSGHASAAVHRVAKNRRLRYSARDDTSGNIRTVRSISSDAGDENRARRYN